MGMIRSIGVFIIEGHTGVRQALELCLRSSSRINVTGAVATVAEADVTGFVQRPDVILLGLKHSDHQAFDLAIETVKGLARWGIAIIILASYSDDFERALLLQAGARRYLVKDINTAELKAAIEGVAEEMIVRGERPTSGRPG
jgi:DNA-binding NarL/FixJ family response regulator